VNTPAPTPRPLVSAASAVLAGLLFGAGLIIGGMTDPTNVLAFLDFTGAWRPALAFVMAGGVAVHFLLMQFVLKRPAPILAPTFQLPPATALDRRLLIGSAIFGVGWGLAGFCPGPGLVSGGSGSLSALVFVGAMAVGMLLEHAVLERPATAPSAR
jgi:uncharacterized membrane protein YedE/YeeE